MLAHEAAGRGIPLLLIHAFPLSSQMWKGQMTRLKQRCRVIAPDLPGFGRSARQAKPSVAGMAKEVAGLLEGLGIREQVFIGGLSMGGYVAFEFLRQFPERVRGLGLFSTRAAADSPEGRRGRLKTSEKIGREGLGPFSRAILPKLLGRSTLEEQPALADQLVGMIRRNRPEGVADALLAMARRRDSTDLLPAIRCPTLVVAGEEDAFIPLSEGRGMKEKIPCCRWALIRKAGHLVNLEQPEAFQQALERFLE